MIKNKKILLSADRDIPLLKFLWRWKLATTAALKWKFFPSKSAHTTYNQLLRLKNGGFIKHRITDQANGFVWTLSLKGFKAIQDSLPSLMEAGYDSETLNHDFLVTALHIGDWFISTPPKVKFFTEQQLRRYAVEEYPDWVPKSQSHRPDGYTLLPLKNQLRVVAFEVELSTKPNDKYQEVAEFYSDEDSIARVIWLVPSASAARRLEEQFSQSGVERSNIHNFITVPDFKNSLWGAIVFIGPEKGKTLLEFLDEKPCAKLVQTLVRCPTHPLLDIRKSPYRSRTSALAPKS